MQPVSLKLENFQGPLELLLHLVQKSEIDILEIPLHTVTSQFHELLEEEGLLEQGGDFLAHASLLLLLKSRSLLPGAKGEEEGIDVRLEILDKIREYCAFKLLAKDLGMREELQQERLPRGFREEHAPVETELKTALTSADLAEMVADLLRKAAFRPAPIQEEEWPLPEVMTYFRERMERDNAVAFEDLFAPSRPRGHLITLFLVLLELMKHQEVIVVDRGQKNIWIERRHG
ncbi:MAG: ScpA family protein [Parachlamydiales bacterium]